MNKKTDDTTGRVIASETANTKVQRRKVKDADVLQKLNTLHNITAQIDSTRSREEILNILRSGAKSLLDYEVCFTSLLNQTKTHFIVNILSSHADASELNHMHFSVCEGMPGWVIKNQATFIGDVESVPLFSEAIERKLQELGIQSLLIVPLRTCNEVIGSLAFGTSIKGYYTEDEAAIAQLLALYVATSINDASIFEDARKRIAQIELINEVSNQLTSMLQLDQLLNAAASTIQKTFNYFDVTVFFLTDDKSTLELVAHSGSFVDFLPHDYRQKVDQGIVGWVVRHGEKVLCNDVLHETRYLAYEYHNTKSELAIPIRIENEVAGVLNIEDTKLHAFDETDAIVLETLSDQLGIAIKNAKLYDEIRTANLKLTELDRMKSEFLGIVSHDFRSPLSSISLAGRALLKNEVVQEHPRIKEYLEIIVNQAGRLNQLAEDTLSITKLESGQLNYYFKIVNVERLIQDAVSMVRFSSKHQFDYQVDSNVIFIKGDQTKLRQVVQNVISNAVKYSPRGGKVRTVVQEYSEDQILFSVSDEGIGIPVEQMDKLFKKFSRVESGEVRDIKGAGLGLWICREIIEAHGGKIWAESEFGKGTTMKFTLNKA